MEHRFSHAETVTEPTGRCLLDICTCGSVMSRGECLGGHGEIVALLRGVTA